MWSIGIFLTYLNYIFMDEVNNQSPASGERAQNSTSLSQPPEPITPPPAPLPPGNPNNLVPPALPSSKPLTALILGVIALIAWIYPYGGMVIAGLGLYLGIKGKNTTKKRLAVTGIILCSIGLVLSLVNLTLYYLYVNITDNQSIADLPNPNASLPNSAGTASSTSINVSSWQEFTSTSSGFSILVPNVPQKQTQSNVPIAGTKMTYTVDTYTALDLVTAYLITVGTYPVKISSEDPKPILESAVNEMVKEGAGKIVSSSFGDFGTYKSLAFVLSGGNVNLTFKGKAILTAQKLYIVIMRAPASKFNDSYYQKYIGSLKIL